MSEFESIYEPKEHFKYLKFIKDHNFYDYIEDSPRGAVASHSVNAAYQMYINRQDKIDELQKRVDEVCDLLDRAEVNHKHLLTKYQSTKAMEMSSSKMLSRVDQILNALNESMKDFKEMDLYDKGYRVAVGYVIADLEKAMRGENDQSN